MSFWKLMGRRATQGLCGIAPFSFDRKSEPDKRDTPREPYTGLLFGANEKYFSSDLGLKSAAKLIKCSDQVFREAVHKDIKCTEDTVLDYLHNMAFKATAYLKNDEICGRLEAVEEIKNNIFVQKGSLAFVTGGTSVGKSKIMHNIVTSIEKEQGKVLKKVPQARVSVVLIDGRSEDDVLSALNNNLSGFQVTTVAEAMAVLANKHPNNTDHSVLILDEANVFFSGEDTQGVRRLFDAAVLQTKQLQRMSVVLVSTDGSLPTHLLNLGLNRAHITHTLVINEPTPQETRDLLRNTLGVGEHLSNALLNYFGGNVYQICAFLRNLPIVYELDQSISVFMGPGDGISRALHAWKEDKQNKEEDMLTVLEQVARTGFVPMDITDKRARLLAKYNVCAYLASYVQQYQVPKEVREGGKEGLVPSSQLMRMLIAHKLAMLEEDKKKLCGK